jgi:DNA-binding response OmpR family regulator
MKRLHILVVEDDDTLRDLLAEVLRGWGYQAVVVPSGARAVELLETQLFEVAVVDIHLPEMDGVELLRHLKRHDPSIEVLMMTGDPTVATAVETLKLGAYDYLTKPLVLEELRHLLDHILERRLLRQEVNALRSRLGDQAETSAAATHSTAIGFHAEATTPNTVVLGDKDASLRIPTGTAPPTAVAALAGNLYAVDTGAAGELWLKTSNTGTATTPSFAGWTKIPTSTGAESLDALSDVDTTTVAPLDKTGLVWNATNAEWEPGTSVTVSTAPPTPGPGNAPTIDGLLWVVVT